MPENEVPEFLFDKDQIRTFINECERDRRLGLHPEYIAEGERLARSFRKLFPNVSDKDLGTIVMAFTQVFALIASSSAMDLSHVIDQTTSGYAYAASDLLSSALAVEDLTNW